MSVQLIALLFTSTVGCGDNGGGGTGGGGSGGDVNSSLQRIIALSNTSPRLQMTTDVI